jgi:hypothetical protein
MQQVDFLDVGARFSASPPSEPKDEEKHCLPETIQMREITAPNDLRLQVEPKEAS